MIQNKVEDIRTYFKQQLHEENFVIDKTGAKTIELIGASFHADETSIFGIPNHKYITAEIDWYLSQSTNINDIYGTDYMANSPPSAWKMTANKHGEINSNYGYLIYSNKYYSQYRNVLNELTNNPDGRRATMVYNRPSIWQEYNENGKSDFICTNAVTYYIRDNKLHCVVQMRSNDVIFGYKNDYAWQKFVLDQLSYDLTMSKERLFDPGILSGDIYWQVQNLHIYDRHFDLVE